MDVTCYVITLRSRPLLLEQFMRRWNRADGRAITPVYAEADHNPVRSCYDTHHRLLTKTHEPIAVFEEDAVFSAAFTLDVQVPDTEGGPPAIAYLGGQHLLPPVPLTPGWVQPRRINRTHGYLALRPQLLADGLRAHTHAHVDDALDALDVPRVALARFTVGQAAGLSSINGHVYRTDRFWND